MSPNWKKLVVSGSDATLNSLNISTSVTASNFTGSFTGDGSNLTNVPVDFEQVAAYDFTFTSSSTIAVTHSLNTSNPFVQVYDELDEQVIPQTVRIVNLNTIEVVFPTITSGKVIVAKGGHVITTSDLSFIAQSFTSQSSINVDHNLNTITPIVQVYDNNNEQVIPQKIQVIDSSSVLVEFPTVQSGRIAVSKGGHLFTTSDLSFVAQTFTSQSSITVSHNFSTTAPIVQVYNDSGAQVIPQEIQVIDADTVQVTFPTAISGQVAISKGGPVLTGTNLSGSYSGSFNSSDHFLPAEDDQFDLGSPSKKWRSLYLSGSTIYLGTLQLKDQGGSFTVKTDDGAPVSQTIDGSLTTNEVALKGNDSFNIITTASITTGVFDETALINPTISPDQYSGANIEYVIQRPGASRSGTIMTSWSGSSVSYTDFSATGVGDTTDLTFDVVFANNNIRLRAYSAGSGSGAWNLHTLFKLFPYIS